MKKVVKTKLKLRTKILIVMLAMLLAFASLTVYAYFSTRAKVYTADGGYKYAKLGMSLDLLFDQINSDDSKNVVADGTDLGILKSKGATEDAQDVNYTFDHTAEWGSAQNPYIISDIRHLQNLSALQEIGYFDDLYISTNKTDGTYNGGKNIPYFLVCNPDGTPVTIDGSDITFSPIGDDQYPFVGYVGGAFEEGNTVVDGKSSNQSTIYNITVKTDQDIIDVGLFGCIGYLGNEPSISLDGEGNIITQDFNAVTSTVKDLLLYDVKISVENPTLMEKLGSFAEHVFAYKQLPAENQGSVPHENHHIGILAGHVEYATVEYISVYYSADDVCAINLSHAKTYEDGTRTNYLSSTGIIGFLDNMNPECTENGVSAGSGVSSDSIGINSIGGTGGGQASGLGTGYVTAQGLYTMYNGTGDGDLRLVDATDESGKPLCTRYVRKRLLWGTQTTNRYYFYDGVFTFALSSENTNANPNQDRIEATWVDDEGHEKAEADTFSVGSNDDTKWKKNFENGNYALSAFLTQVKNNDELNDALAKNKTLIIMHHEIDNNASGNAFLMELSTSSDRNGINGDDQYTTNGSNVKFADEDLRQSILDTYNANGSLADFGVSKEVTDRFNFENGKATGLGDYTVLNLVESDDANILNTIKTKYNIEIEYNEDNTLSYMKDNGDPLYKGADGIYLAQTYSEYYYYSYTTTLLRTRVTLYFHTEDGEDIEIYRDSTLWASGDNADVTVGKINGGKYVNVVTTGVPHKFYVYNGYKEAPILCVDPNGKWYYQYNTTNEVLLTDEGVVVPDSAKLVNYVLYNQKERKYYIYTNNKAGSEITDVEIVSVDDDGINHYQGISGGKNYTFTSDDLVIAEQMDFYTFSNGQNRLRLLYRETKFLGIVTSRNYSIWNGPDSAIPSGVTYNYPKANVFFDAKDNSCQIRYSKGVVNRYVHYNKTNFNGVADENNEDTKLYIYILEGVAEIDYGIVTYDPTDVTPEAYQADRYVLWPEATYSGANGRTESHATYSIKELQGSNTVLTSNMLLANNGWKNNKGQPLSYADLHKKFAMEKGASWGTVLSVLNGNYDVGGNTIVAPVGTLGVEANIPLGTIAFRVNNTNANNKARVIVAVPVADYYEGQVVDGQNTTDYFNEINYFGIWKVNANGQDRVWNFNANNATEKFELPKSHPYDPKSVAASSEYVLIKDNKGNVTQRAYLNGDRVLVAYEFSVPTQGVYLLGATNGPMEIVYFSVDATASSGRDGSAGSKIGNIDFVYDYDGEVITVKHSGADEAGGENYHNYYATLSLMYTDNSYLPENGTTFTDINSFEVYVRRQILTSDYVNHNTAGEHASLKVLVSGTDKELVKVEPYAPAADEIKLTR